MGKYYAKCAIPIVALTTICFVGWITYHNFEKLRKAPWIFKTIRKRLYDSDAVLIQSKLINKDVTWSKIKRRPKPNEKEIHSGKWIVATSVATPTAQVKKLSKIKGWNVIVVGDTKTPTNWK